MARHRHFDVDSDGVVTKNHTATRGADSIELVGNTGKTFHAFFNKQDCTSNLIGQSSMTEGTSYPVQKDAKPGRWQLGTDAANNGKTGQGHGGPTTSNGVLTVGSGSGDSDDGDDRGSAP